MSLFIGKDLMLGKIEGRRRGEQRMKWLDSGINESMGLNLHKLQETVKDRKSLACYSSWGHKESDMS